MEFIHQRDSSLKYYCHKDTGRYVAASTTDLDRDDLIEVPSSAANLYQVWDGDSWRGSALDLSQRYGKFRVLMLSSKGWGRIKIHGGKFAPEFMGAIAFMEENPGMVKILWNRIIFNLSEGEKPEPSEVTQWQKIVASTQIGIEWIGDRQDAFDITNEGKMI